jgi:hypothetical protein
MESDATTWVDVAQGIAAVAGIVVATLVAWMPYARRPKLRVEEDPDRSNSRVEASGLGGLPHLRVLVSNAQRRRAAQGTRVLVEGYSEQGSQDAPTTLGHPSLEWPTTREDAAATGAVTVFAGARRPITLGYFVCGQRDAGGEFQVATNPDYLSRNPAGWVWHLKLTIGFDINDHRDKLPAVDGGYVIRLLVGADDGAARRFDVDINWDGDPTLTPVQVLDSALDKLAVREV